MDHYTSTRKVIMLVIAAFFMGILITQALTPDTKTIIYLRPNVAEDDIYTPTPHNIEIRHMTPDMEELF